MIRSTLSYGQLYELFGYNEKLDFATIIEELLFSISDVEYIDSLPVPNMACGDIHSCFISSYYVFRKTRLSQYLSYQAGYKLLMRMEARLRTIAIKRTELKEIKWFKISQWFSLKREIAKLSSQTVSIKNVFAFFAYKANRMGVSVKKLHQQITDAAETYSPQMNSFYSL